MWIKPFSVQRLLLYISCILAGALIIQINRVLFSGINSDLLILSISLYALSSAIYYLFQFFGVPQRIEKKEWEQFRKEVGEAFRNEVAQMKRQMEFKKAFELNNDTYSLQEQNNKSKTCLEQLEEAKKTWRYKKRKERTKYEEFHYTQYLLKKLSKIQSLVLSLVNFMIGISTLNHYFNSILLFTLVMSSCVLLLVIMFTFHKFTFRKYQRLAEDVYPESVKKALDTLKQLKL